MAKDNYFVIVYYILKYFYECLKNGNKSSEEILYLKCYPTEINDDYLDYIRIIF